MKQRIALGAETVAFVRQRVAEIVGENQEGYNLSPSLRKHRRKHCRKIICDGACIVKIIQKNMQKTIQNTPQKSTQKSATLSHEFDLI